MRKREVMKEKRARLSCKQQAGYENIGNSGSKLIVEMYVRRNRKENKNKKNLIIKKICR
jgi:hypothetical protein